MIAKERAQRVVESSGRTRVVKLHAQRYLRKNRRRARRNGEAMAAATDLYSVLGVDRGARDVEVLSLTAFHRAIFRE